MNSQRTIFGTGKLGNGNSTAGACESCENLLKEVAFKDRLIGELQVRLKRINEMSSAPREDYSRSFKKTGFEQVATGISTLANLYWKPPLTTPPFSSDSESSSGSLDGASSLEGTIQNQVNSAQPTPCMEVVAQNKRANAGLPKVDRNHEVKLIKVQDIIDRVIENSPTRGEESSQRSSEKRPNDRVITIQEIINSTVDKSRKRNRATSERKFRSALDFDCGLDPKPKNTPSGKESTIVLNDESNGGSDQSVTTKSLALSKATIINQNSSGGPHPVDLSIPKKKANPDDNICSNNSSPLNSPSSLHGSGYLHWKRYHLENHKSQINALPKLEIFTMQNYVPKKQ